MSYADRDTSGSRIVAIILVSLIVAGFGYAFVTGLAMSVAKKVSEKLNTFDVAPPPPPPPPDKPPPPPPDQPNLPPPPTQVTAPPIKLDIPAPNPVPVAPPMPPQPISPPAPPAPVAPPAPPAPKPAAIKGGPKGNPGSWFTNDDYPADAKRASAQGRVTVVLGIDTSGRVTECRVTSSSTNNSSLDAQTCNLAKRRGRFIVQKDADGNAQPYTFTLPGIRWTLTDE